MSKGFVNQENTHSRPDGAYGEVIRKIAKDGVCPFCREHLTEYHKHPLDERKFWWITDNMWPYKPSLQHKLVIHKEHVSHVNELSNDAWVELLEIQKELSAKLNIVGGTLVMRFGETHFTGASVSHLHTNLVQSDPEDPSYDPKKGLVTRIG